MPEDTIHQIAFSDYPKTLQNMHNPPKKLYLRGQLPENVDQKYLCIVGSRKWTTYGRDAVKKIIGGLRGYPISIVSGLAIGIDSIAHVAALEAGLHCVAFPGSSLEWDKVYPTCHIPLAKKIFESGGALLSQWEPEYPVGKWSFPSRNILMAGISDATLVVEAGLRSGSLMTAKHSEDFHREVWAIPGPITAPQSYGPHMLIRNGSVPITSSDDVLEAFGFSVDRSGANSVLRKLDNLDEESAKIIKMLSLEEIPINTLIGRMKLPIQTLNEKLTILELEGVIRIEESVVSLITSNQAGS